MPLSYDLDSVQKFGCLTIDGQVYSKASEYGAGVISFGDTDQASEESLLSWLPFEGKWVSNQVNLTSVSWKQLHEQALCRGRVVIIDEKPYLCRSLTTESPDGKSSEWDRFIRLYRNLDYIFHWRGEYTWGQEASLNAAKEPEFVTARGWKTPEHTKRFEVWKRTPGIGFRPVLELLGPSLVPEKLSRGTWVTLHLNNGTVSGKFYSATPYDIVLSGRLKWKKADHFIPRLSVDYENGFITVDRSAVCYVQGGWTPN